MAEVDPEAAKAELARVSLEYIKALRVVNSDEIEQQKQIRDYLGVKNDGYRTQEADEIPEVEAPKGISELASAITKLAEREMQKEEPDVQIVGWAALTEKKWTAKQRMAIWLTLTMKHKQALLDMGIDALKIPKPELEATVVKLPEATKELYNDDRSMGFVLRFRYLQKAEHDRVRNAIGRIPGRQYHDGSKADARITEPHWVVPGDSVSVKALYEYLVTAFNGSGYRNRWVDSDPEPTSWVIKDGVADRMQQILTRGAMMLKMSKAHHTEWKPFNEYSWDGKNPMPFQYADIAYVLAATEESRISKGKYGQGVMIGNPMGLGKTMVAILSINEAWEEELRKNPNLKREDLRALIMCPASVKINWAREIQGWLEPFDYRVQILRGTQIQPIWGNFVICNPQLMQKEYNHQTYEYEPAPLYVMILAQKWFAIVADESHQYKSWKSQRTANALELFSGRRYNVRKLSMEQWRWPVPMRVMMSGSPILNRPAEFPTQLESLGMLDQFGGRARFENMYCSSRNTYRLKELNVKLREMGYRRIEKEDMVATPDERIIPLKNVPQTILNTTWVPREQWASTLEQQEYEFLPGVLGQMPPKIRTVNYLQLSNRAIYNKAVQDFIGWLRDNFAGMEDSDVRVARAARNAALTKITYLKMLAARGKVRDAIAWIKRFMEESGDEKLVFYVDHRDVFEAITNAFPDSARIIGGQDEVKRQDNVDLFQNNPEVRLMVAMLTAGGIGINLNSANYMAFMELGWGPAIHDQAEDRIWGRLSNLHGAAIYYLLAQNTIDEQIAAIIDTKREIVTASTQGADVDATAVITDIARQILDNAAKEKVAIIEDEKEEEDSNGEG